MSSMSTRLILNGRVYEFGDRQKPYSSEQLEPPLGYINPPQDSYVDGPWKLRYRLIDNKSGLEWLTMPELQELLHQNEVWVATKVVEGAIDAAMVRGSGIPIFRIRDRLGVIREAIVAPVEPAKRAAQKTADAPHVQPKVRKNKDRWDK